MSDAGVERNPIDDGQINPKGYFPKRYLLFFMVFNGMCLHGLFLNNIYLEGLAKKGDHIDVHICYFPRSLGDEFIYLYIILRAIMFFAYGRIADIIGGTKLFGFSIAAATFIMLLIPAAVASGIDNSEIGAFNDILYMLKHQAPPGIMNMMAKWIPPQERGVFASNMFVASFIRDIAMIPSSEIVNLLGHNSMCFMSAILGITWCLFWYRSFNSYSTPIGHRSISLKEKNYILRHTMANGTSYEGVTPRWIDIFLSKQVWIIMITSVMIFFASSHCFITIPELLMQRTGSIDCLILHLPEVTCYTSAFLSGAVSDYCISREIMKTITIRKFFTSIGVLATATAFFTVMMLSVRGWNTTHLIICALGSGLVGACNGGFLLAFVDIAPNLAATLFSIREVLCFLVIIYSDEKIGNIVSQGEQGLSKLFCLVIAVYLVSIIIYWLFGEGKLMRWNKPHKPLNSSTDDERSKYTVVRRDSYS